MSATPTEAQIATFQSFCYEVGGALAEMVDKAERLGMAAPLTLTAIIGSVAAIATAHGLKRENIVAALEIAFDDVKGA